MAADGEGLQLLFEFENSRRQIVTRKSAVRESLEKELERFGLASVRVRYSSDSSGSDSYLLQRWSDAWNNYIDVEDENDLEDRDKVTVVPMTTAFSSSQKVTAKAQSVIARVKCPSEATTLSSLFPSRKRVEGPSFDPTAECVVLPQQKKKKSAIKSNQKPSTVTVVLLKDYSCIVPKGKRRQALASKGRVRAVKLMRQMKPMEVKEAILKVFKDFHLTSYVVLDTVDTGHTLVQADEQNIDGEVAISRRGCLYLCEKLETSTSGSESDDSPKISSRPRKVSALISTADKLLQGLKAPVKLDEDSDSEPSAIQGDRECEEKDEEEKQTQEVISLSDDEGDRAYELAEWRQLREEQDRAYAESLLSDQQKREEALRQEEEAVRREELLRTVRDKWTNEKLSCPNGAKFSLRFPDCVKVDCSLPTFASAKDLYEIAYAHSSMCKFWLYTTHPRRCVTPDVIVSDIISPAVLVVEEDNDAPDITDIVSLNQLPQAEISPDNGTGEEEDILHAVHEEREKYAIDSMDTHQGLPHHIRRCNLFEDVISLYTEKSESLFREYPLRIKFAGEKAVDTGGVCRDLFSAFWDKAYEKAFDGTNALMPALHPHVDMEMFPLLGAIFSHGFLSCGFIPVRLGFPTIVALVLGTTVTIPDSMLITSFQEFLSCHDQSVIKDALNKSSTEVTFKDHMTTSLISILNPFGCKHRPTPQNIQSLVVQIARHEFLTKPLAALNSLHSGVPVCHAGFWNSFSVNRLFRLHHASRGSPQHVIDKLVEPLYMDSNQQQVFAYLTSFIGNLTAKELMAFLRFVTGSSSLSEKGIHVSFNTLTGMARRPISHTCSCELQLSSSYISYIEFSEEFYNILRNSDTWEMHAI